MSGDDGDCVLSVGGQSLGGWTDVEVIVGIELLPGIFNIGMTEKSPGAARSIVQPGDKCTVMLGADPVITGYVDRYVPSFTAPNSHAVSLLGRSKSADLVDCSAEWPGGQIAGSSVLEICKKLCAPYGINVQGDVDTGPPIPQYNLVIGESAYAIMERFARFRNLLIYDLPNGDIVLTQAGNDKMGSGFKQGYNIQRAQAEYSMDGRFSEYEAFITATDTLVDLGNGGNLLTNPPIKDAGVPRHRLRTIISEGGALGNNVAVQRAQWECNRRAGRGFAVTVTADSWRDDSGKLWTPNATVPLDADALKLPPSTDWLLSQVAFRRNDRDGTTAECVCMPKPAFQPEPILLLPPGVPGELAGP